MPYRLVFTNRGGPFCRELDRLNQKWRWLLVDRRKRRPCLCTMKQVVFFFPLTEAKNGDDHTVFRFSQRYAP